MTNYPTNLWHALPQNEQHQMLTSYMPFALCQNALSLLGSSVELQLHTEEGHQVVLVHTEKYTSISHCVFTYNISQMVYYTIILEWSFFFFLTYMLI